jgi:hypothetical protein
MEQIRISASGFAECVAGTPGNLRGKLRPFKFRNKGEGAGRSAYYRLSLSAIRAYHASNQDATVLKKAQREIGALWAAAATKLEKIRCLRNVEALEAYARIYGKRRFTIRPNHRLSYRIGRLTVTAQPDLWVEENGTEVLIKIGVAKKSSLWIDVILYLIRKAAISSGYRIRARNIVYLDITNATEHCCNTSLSRFNRAFHSLADQIEAIWPSIEPPVAKK